MHPPLLSTQHLGLPQAWAATSLTVVMPTYNEIANLARICERVLALPLPGLHLKVVDDDSPDGTGQLADKLADRVRSGTDREAPRMSVLHRPGKAGLGRAYAQGMTKAVSEGARYVLQMDADGSHPAEAIPQMLGVALSTGCAVVVGSRYVCGGSLGADWAARRRLLSAWANWYAGRVLRLRLRDITSGFNLWRADVLAGFGLDRITSAGYSFQVETKYLALAAGQAAIEIPIRFEDRQAGVSKMNLAAQLEAAFLPWRLRFGATQITSRKPQA